MKAFPLEAIEKASLDELRALQLERLEWSLAHAYEKVPHYRKKFDAAGVKPAHLRALEDLARFPFTTKADLRETYPFGMFAVPMDRIVRIHASSGTTGKPTVVGCTAKDIDTWSHVMARSIRAAGAICRRFAEEGARILVADRNAEAAQSVAKTIDGKARLECQHITLPESPCPIESEWMMQ